METRSTPPERPTITLPAAARRLRLDQRTLRTRITAGVYEGGWWRPEGGKQKRWFVYSDVPPFVPPGTTAPADGPLAATLELIAEMREREARRDEQMHQIVSAVQDLVAEVRTEQKALRADQLDYDARMSLMAAANSETGQGAAEILAGAARLQNALEMTLQVLAQIHGPKFGPSEVG